MITGRKVSDFTAFSNLFHFIFAVILNYSVHITKQGHLFMFLNEQGGTQHKRHPNGCVVFCKKKSACTVKAFGTPRTTL